MVHTRRWSCERRRGARSTTEDRVHGLAIGADHVASLRTGTTACTAPDHHPDYPSMHDHRPDDRDLQTALVIGLDITEIDYGSVNL